MTPVDIASLVGTAVGTGLAAWALGMRRGRKKATEEGEPAEFSRAWLDRAERNFKKMHDDAGEFTRHILRIDQLESAYLKLEGEITKRGESLERELNDLSKAVGVLSSDIAGLRGEMGFERRKDGR